jgi:hypothetical protein
MVGVTDGGVGKRGHLAPVVGATAVALEDPDQAVPRRWRHGRWRGRIEHRGILVGTDHQQIAFERHAAAEGAVIAHAKVG